jgi:hypothetical protein
VHLLVCAAGEHSDDGRAGWRLLGRVRYLPKGARFGTSRTRTSERDMVEFYDLSLADDAAGTGPPGFGPRGQYITRYTVEALLADNRADTRLNLTSASRPGPRRGDHDTVRAWLRHQHGQRPIRKVTLTDLLEQYDPARSAWSRSQRPFPSRSVWPLWWARSPAIGAGTEPSELGEAAAVVSVSLRRRRCGL